MRLILILISVLIVLAAFGLAALGMWKLTPPVTHIEKIIPNDRFPK